jgi:hypothetical protein
VPALLLEPCALHHTVTTVIGLHYYRYGLRYHCCICYSLECPGGAIPVYGLKNTSGISMYYLGREVLRAVSMFVAVIGLQRRIIL